MKSEQEIRERLKVAKKELDISEHNQPQGYYDDIEVIEWNELWRSIDSEIGTLEWILEIKYED